MKIIGLVLQMTVVLAAWLPPVSALASPIKLEDKNHEMTPVKFAPGEVQSVVIPPGLKTECPAGRVLITNDILSHNYENRLGDGLVMGRNLNDLDGAQVNATFPTLPPNPTDYAFYAFDHDLISFRNGDVILIGQVLSKVPLAVKPWWFDDTYRWPFGPGARTVIMAFRSTDCGQTFHYLGQMDPAAIEDGSCAYPQPEIEGQQKKPFNMGGTDGVLIYKDPKDETLFMTHQCVGYSFLDRKGLQEFYLSAQPLNKTLLATSTDQGKSWTSHGLLSNFRGWRIGALRVSPADQPGTDLLAIAAGRTLLVGKRNSSGRYEFDPNAIPIAANPVWGSWWPWQDSAEWQQSAPTSILATGKQRDSAALVGFNAGAHTVLFRVPNSDLIGLAVPASLNKVLKSASGYQIFLYNARNNSISELSPIAPTNPGRGGLILHVVAVDVGEGPILLYWTDVDADTKRATIRGRFILGADQASHSSDFVISRDKNQSREIDLTTTQGPRWYGDYQMAGGYGSNKKVGSLSIREVHYFPVWIEPQDAPRFTEVVYQMGFPERVSAPAAGVVPSYRVLPIGPWKPLPASVDRASLPQNFTDELQRDYGRSSRLRIKAPSMVRPQPAPVRLPSQPPPGR